MFLVMILSLKKKELICESCIFLAFAEVRGGTLDLDSCESLYVCWELNLDRSQCPLLQVRKIPAAGTRRGLQQSSCSLLRACWNSGPLILQSLLLLLGSFIEHVSFQQASGIIPENNSTWKTLVFTGEGREELQGALRIACLLISVLCSLALILFLP